MKLSFYGAAREVTGSCFLVTTGQTHVLVDCGVLQQRSFAEHKNTDAFLFDPKTIDVVLLTHAHLDHCGRLPKLYRDGFRGTVYATPATRDLTRVMLIDSARVIEHEATRQGRQPLYQPTDVTGLMKLFSPVNYRQPKKVASDVTAVARDAGHILGSSCWEVIVRESGQTKKLVFSGDLGNPPAPIVTDPDAITDGADYVIMESTYGGRVHESKSLRRKLLAEMFINTVKRGGVLMIPAFALERTQEVIYELNWLVERHQLPACPIYIDSPLAIGATTVYKQYSNLFDRESRALINAGDDLFNFPGLIYTKTPEQSKRINITPGPKVIIAGSGMCHGGRILHHLKHYLPDPNNQLLFITYLAAGSLGRKIFDGAKFVDIDGRRIPVRANVAAIGGYSSHGDSLLLTSWLRQMKKTKPKTVFLVHGELDQAQALGRVIGHDLGYTTVIPKYRQSVVL